MKKISQRMTKSFANIGKKLKHRLTKKQLLFISAGFAIILIGGVATFASDGLSRRNLVLEAYYTNALPGSTTSQIQTTERQVLGETSESAVPSLAPITSCLLKATPLKTSCNPGTNQTTVDGKCLATMTFDKILDPAANPTARKYICPGSTAESGGKCYGTYPPVVSYTCSSGTLNPSTNQCVLPRDEKDQTCPEGAIIVRGGDTGAENPTSGGGNGPTSAQSFSPASKFSNTGIGYKITGDDGTNITFKSGDCTENKVPIGSGNGQLKPGKRYTIEISYLIPGNSEKAVEYTTPRVVELNIPNSNISNLLSQNIVQKFGIFQDPSVPKTSCRLFVQNNNKISSSPTSSVPGNEPSAVGAPTVISSLKDAQTGHPKWNLYIKGNASEYRGYVSYFVNGRWDNGKEFNIKNNKYTPTNIRNYHFLASLPGGCPGTDKTLCQNQTYRLKFTYWDTKNKNKKYLYIPPTDLELKDVMVTKYDDCLKKPGTEICNLEAYRRGWVDPAEIAPELRYESGYVKLTAKMTGTPKIYLTQVWYTKDGDSWIPVKKNNKDTFRTNIGSIYVDGLREAFISEGDHKPCANGQGICADRTYKLKIRYQYTMDTTAISMRRSNDSGPIQEKIFEKTLSIRVD